MDKNKEKTMNKLQSRRFNLRALLSLVMFGSFIFLPSFGLALHLSANAPFQPTQHLLMTIHNLAGIIFMFSLILHLVLNWRPLWNYIKMAVGKVGMYRKELVVAALLLAIPLGLGILHVFELGG
jgi:hypothetical protein